MQDQKLIRKYVEEGSEEAFREITARYINLVYKTCLREVRDRQTAEDATQAVFILLAQKAPRMKHDTPLAGWLFHAARLVARNAVKRERRYAAMIKAAEPKLDTPPASDVTLVLNDALARLAAGDRQAILLRFYQGLSFAELGAEIGVSEDAAVKRVSRAVDRLRIKLTKAGVGVLTVSLLAVLESGAARSATPGMAGAVTAAGSGMKTGGAAGASPEVLKLVQGAARDMLRTKLIAVTVGAVVFCAGAAGTAYGRYAGAAHRPVSARKTAPSRKSASDAVAPRAMKTTLPDGTTVELLGVTADQHLMGVNGNTYSENGWWTAAGESMGDPPGTPSFRVGQIGADFVTRTLCFRIVCPTSGEIATQGNLLGFTPADYGGNLHKDAAPAENASVKANVPTYGLITANLPSYQSKFRYRLGVSTGVWRILAETPLTLHPALDDMFISHGSYIAGPSVETTGAPVVYYLDKDKKFVPENLLPPGQTVGDAECRATALDVQGQVVPQTKDGIWEPKDFLRIATIRLEHRPWMWAQFDDIAACAKNEIPMPQARPQFQQTMGDATVGVLAVIGSRADGRRSWLPNGKPIAGKIQGLAFAGPDAWSSSYDSSTRKMDVHYDTLHGRLSIIYDISRPKNGPPWRTFSAEVPGQGSSGPPSTSWLPSSVSVTIRPGQTTCALDIRLMDPDPRLPSRLFHFDNIAVKPIDSQRKAHAAKKQ